jgi:hypothetical protein
MMDNELFFSVGETISKSNYNRRQTTNKFLFKNFQLFVLKLTPYFILFVLRIQDVKKDLDCKRNT